VAASPHLRIDDVRLANASVRELEGLDRSERLLRVYRMVKGIAREREGKEREAARLAAEYATDSDLQRMDSALKALQDLPETSIEARALPGFRAVGREFHIAVAAASHSRELEAEITRLLDDLYVWLGPNVPRKQGQTALHVAIVEAIRRHDTEAAVAAMTAHSKNARRALDELLLRNLPILTLSAVLDMRERAEGLAALLAADRHTPDDDDQMEDALRSTRDIPEGGFENIDQAAACREADRNLHMAIATAAHDPHVYSLVDVAYRHFSDLLCGTDTHLEGFRPRQRGDHNSIVEAIRDGRAGEAVKLTSDHIASTREALENLLLARWPEPVTPAAH
jgi:DNA-binding GntR family transcriptional regulator